MTAAATTAIATATTAAAVATTTTTTTTAAAATTIGSMRGDDSDGDDDDRRACVFAPSRWPLGRLVAPTAAASLIVTTPTASKHPDEWRVDRLRKRSHSCGVQCQTWSTTIVVSDRKSSPCYKANLRLSSRTLACWRRRRLLVSVGTRRLSRRRDDRARARLSSVAIFSRTRPSFSLVRALFVATHDEASAYTLLAAHSNFTSGRFARVAPKNDEKMRV